LEVLPRLLDAMALNQLRPVTLRSALSPLVSSSAPAQ
jgi:hypothetical protein